MAEPKVEGKPQVRKRASVWGHPRLLLRYVLSQDDTPHHIALGAAIGMFIGLTPTPGIQMLLVIAVYFLCRPLFTFNRPAGLAAVYISNPLTAVPLAWLSYQAGRVFVGGDLTRDELAAVMDYDGFGAWWQTFLGLVTELGWAYLVGSFVVAAVAGVLTYPGMLYLSHLVQGGPEQRPPAEGAVDQELVGAGERS